ncbi:MAG TPA: ABC transporter ATP-binding protein [Ilumatobacteraceae bacterium]|nr:ABC transporter ATP-binding protein [Ilumatobacteraceae bacterium]
MTAIRSLTAEASPTDTREPPRPVLEVSGLTLRFGGVTALTNVSFNVSRGELFGVIGPNGAGKTCILNCLNGVYRPHSGSALLDGRDLLTMRPPATAEAGVARTFQNLALFANLTVIDNLMLGRHHLMKAGPVAGALWWGRARREEIKHRARCAEIMDLLDLGPYRHHPVGLLPYGIQKRIELGRALAMDPTLLLLDEPVAGMNLEETEDMAAHITEIREELDIAIILVAHQMHLVMDLVDRLLVLAFGKIVAMGAPIDIQNDERVVEAYVGVES